jgi:hypothetical protein
MMTEKTRPHPASRRSITSCFDDELDAFIIQTPNLVQPKNDTSYIVFAIDARQEFLGTLLLQSLPIFETIEEGQASEHKKGALLKLPNGIIFQKN